ARRDARDRSDESAVLLAALLEGTSAAALAVVATQFGNRGNTNANRLTFAPPKPFDANRSFEYLERIVAFGPRRSGSAAMQQQQTYLKEFFEKAGADSVVLQPFVARHPQTGTPVQMANLVASWKPDAAKRYLFCAHYDTRPFPDRDPQNPKGAFVGANDGASGVAGLMELSHHLGELPKNVGVDLVLFDGEELVFRRGDPYFLGSIYFSRSYALTHSRAARAARGNAQQNKPVIGIPRRPYRAGILLDMIGDRELQIYQETNSVRYAGKVSRSVFATAKRLKVPQFDPRVRHTVNDDHLALNETAGVPTVDLIDFDYPRPGFGIENYWHTTKDLPANCSGESIATVVYVIHHWLMNQ
ncbi:MAG: M28 family peptidase, partial [Planctomycetota bacterium]